MFMNFSLRSFRMFTLGFLEVTVSTDYIIPDASYLLNCCEMTNESIVNSIQLIKRKKYFSFSAANR